MGLKWGESEMTALERIDWRPHAPCGAKSKKKNYLKVALSFKNKLFIGLCLQFEDLIFWIFERLRFLNYQTYEIFVILKI